MSSESLAVQSALHVPHGLIGVVHLRALPGDAHGGQSLRQVVDFAMRDAEALAEGGAHGIIVENFGSAPFVKGTAGHRTPPHQAAALARVCSQVRERYKLPTGVNCLRNDGYTALGIAASCDLQFVRINVHAGAYVTDQGVIEGEAAHNLAYRKQLDAPVAILADVLVKHAQPMAPLHMAAAVKETLGRGGADAVIVTGNATGASADAQDLAVAVDAAGGAPVLLGSGTTPDSKLPKGVTGAIVGTWLKKDGVLSKPVDVNRVRRVAELFA